MKKLALLFSCFVICLSYMAAKDREDLNIKYLPDSLKTNAHAIVRRSTTHFEYKSTKSGVETCIIAVTVFDKKGADYAQFQYSCSKFQVIKSFSGKLYSSDGKLLQNYKMSDVRSTEYSSSLASDAKLYFFEPDLPTYPITVEYEYEVNWKNGIVNFPIFFPQPGHYLSVQNASYELSIPDNVEFRLKSLNYKNSDEVNLKEGTVTHKWHVNNLCAIQSEIFQPEIETLVPLVYLCPKSIDFDGYLGEISDWNSMGKWESQLMEGRTELSTEFKNKIIQMTVNASSDKEKVKILYDYLGNTTRYVSIQLGVGGYQPMKATEVCKTGFGDCKALSNYLKSMLSVVGIPSYYSGIILSETDKYLYRDYANFNQMNHVVLMVPLKTDTLWLECTNPRIPFGFVHNGISGHDALVLTQDGGKVVRLPDYPDSLNVERKYAVVSLSADGSALVKMNKKCNVKMYDDNSSFIEAKSDEQIDYLRQEIGLPSVTVGNIKISKDASALPSLSIDYNWNTFLYGSKTGNRLFVPINPFKNSFEGLKTGKRYQPISISAGYRLVDSVLIQIPDGFEIESIPNSMQLNSIFGSFESKVRKTESGVLVEQSIMIPTAVYKPSMYVDFIAFLLKMNNSYQTKMILRKKI